MSPLLISNGGNACAGPDQITPRLGVRETANNAPLLSIIMAWIRINIYWKNFILKSSVKFNL